MSWTPMTGMSTQTSLSPVNDDEAVRIFDKYKMLKSQRENWEDTWDEVTRYVTPNNATVYNNQIGGEQRTQKIYDSTAIHASKMLASYLDGNYTPRSGNWFNLTTGSYELDNDREVFMYFQNAARVINQTMQRSNLYTELYEVYHDLTTVGTATVRIEPDPITDVRYYYSPIWEWIIDENQRGVVDTALRKVEMSIRNIVKMFGAKNTIEKHADLKEMHAKSPLSKLELIQCIEPQDDTKAKTGYSSSYMLVAKMMMLQEKKFKEWPIAIPRFYKSSDEMYGRSPSIDALPDIKQVNAFKKYWIRSVQKAVDPALMVPDTGFMLPLQTVPSGINIYRAGIKDRIEPIPTQNPLLTLEVLKDMQEDIKKAYFTDRLQLPMLDRMTATETVRRSEENDSLMSPIVARLDNELLKVIVMRTFGILNRLGKLGDMPEQLKNTEFDIKFISPIAKSQRFSEAVTLNKVVQASAVAIQAQPDIMDNINGDEVLRHNAELYGLPFEMFRSEEEVAQMRQQRAEQQQAMEQAQLQNMQADTMQKTAKSQGV